MLNFDEEYLEQLILEGIVEFAGLDDRGEMLYSFTPDLETKAPAIHKIVQELHMKDIYYLWESGFLEMDITADNPLVVPSHKALDEEALDTLPPPMRLLLEQIKNEMRRDR